MTAKSDDLLDHPAVAQVLFHPRAEPPIAGGLAVEVPGRDGVTVGGRIYPAEPQSPAVLYFHGNGEIAADYADIATLYARIGLTLLVMDYRGYGASGGTPSAATLLDDAWLAFERAPDLFGAHGLAPGRLYLMGRSLGSAAALEIASRAESGLAGLIIESGFAETWPLVARLGGPVPDGADEQANGFANAEKMAHVTLPTLVIHGEEDWIIPLGDGIKLHTVCAAADKRLVTIPGAGHNDLLMRGLQPYFQAIRDLTFGG